MLGNSTTSKICSTFDTSSGFQSWNRFKTRPAPSIRKIRKKKRAIKISPLAWNRYYHHPRHFADESRVNVCYSPGKTAVTRKPAGKQGFAQTFLIVLARWIQPRPKLAPLVVCTVCRVYPFWPFGEREGEKKAPQTYVRWFSNEQMGKSGVYKGSNWTPKVAWNVFEIALYTENCAREGKELDINWIEIFKTHLHRERNRIFWISIRILTDDRLFKYFTERKIACI